MSSGSVSDQAPHLLGVSAAIKDVDAEIGFASRSDAKVLITGESGVGKEVVARLIHERSRRSLLPLVTINCAGVPDSLLESELFGHVKGSFTDAHRDRIGLLELADGGTVFLDEVGEMSLRMQALLLRFLENGEIQRVGADRPDTRINVRVIAATNRHPLDRIASRDFREDLYYRLNVIQIRVPPLRMRREDIPAFIAHFIRSHAERHRTMQPQIAADALDALVAYDWPGNVRELRNVTERLIVRASGGVVTLADLPAALHTRPRRAAPQRVSMAEVLYDRMVTHGESFWSAVHPLFVARDLTRSDLRDVLRRGLAQTGGTYKGLLDLFNMKATDYKRLLTFLRKHQCQVSASRLRIPAPAIR